ncbi:hypothetical protein CGRA01v4_01325 [Colletotrichum graminicola]|nr:hypothetical protein CGRA01v4_01325 [Colletotrichum graminicola]
MGWLLWKENPKTLHFSRQEIAYGCFRHR